MNYSGGKKLKLREWEKAYLAGFLECKRFTPNDKYGSITTTFNFQMEEVVQRIAKMVGAKIHIMRANTFAETFANANRPAVYTDSKRPRLYFYWRGRRAQQVILAIFDYLSPSTKERFRPLLRKRYMTRSEAGQISAMKRKQVAIAENLSSRG